MPVAALDRKSERPMLGWEPPAELTADAVSARFRAARRRGTPAWLWPEITIAAWREALAFVEEIARHALAGRPAPVAATGDPAAFGLACYTSGTGPLLAWWHDRGLLGTSPEIADLLDLHRRHNQARHRRLTTIATDITRRFETAGIPVIALKGLHTAAYFPADGTRPMADVDLLIAAANTAPASELLTACDLVPGARGARETHWQPRAGRAALRTLLFVHEEDPWSIDLHHSLDQFVGAGAPVVRFDAADPFHRSSTLEGLPTAKGLDQPLLLLHLAAHAGGALHNLTLLRLAELYLVIRRDGDAGHLSWPEVIETGAAIDALGYAYPALRLCEDLMPGTIPAWVIARCAAAAPARVARVVARLTPATAQRVERSSIAEHFMWSSGWAGMCRQLAADLVPATPSWRGAWSIYERRAWQLLRGRLSA